MQTYNEKPAIFGVDILPYSSPRATLGFSLVVMRGGQAVERFERVSLGRLLRLARSMKPRFIALDNVYELASSAPQLLRIISALPVETQLVQVTGSPKEGMRPLHIIASEHGLSLSSRSAPVQAAEVGAKLVAMGVGSYIEAFKHRTEIKVSKGRVFGPGGMSQQRYRRRLCLAVLQVAHKIREGLKSEGLDFEMKVRRSRWGYEGCHFIVFADRARLYGIVKSIRGPDVRVSIEPIMASEIEFKSLQQVSPPTISRRSRPTIVGIDPGIVTGVATISLEGEVLSLHSGRGLDRASIIESLTSAGHPVLLCADVNPPPETVRKVAAALDARVFYPEGSLSTIEKREITRVFVEALEEPLKVDDTHQRDALAAAIKAYMSLKSNFEEADACIRNSGLRISRDLVRAEIVRGATISEAIELATPIPRPVTRAAVESREEEPLLNARIRSLEDRIRAQREIIEKLSALREESQEKTQSLEQRAAELESNLQRERSVGEAELRKSREFDVLNSRIRSLEAELQNRTIESEAFRYKLEHLRTLLTAYLRGEITFVKHVPSLTKHALEQATSESAISKSDIIHIGEPATATLNGAQSLTTKGVHAVIVESELPPIVNEVIEGHGVPVLNQEDALLENFDGFYYAKRARLETLLQLSRKRIEVKEKQSSKEMLNDLLNEYRHKREKDT